MTVAKTPVSSAPLNRNCVPRAPYGGKARAPFPFPRKDVAAVNEVPLNRQIPPSLFPFLCRERTAADIERDMNPAAQLDAQMVAICPRCNAPVRDFGYTVSDCDRTWMHGECKAQLMLLDLKAENDAKVDEAAQIKKQKRKEYGIGWKAEMIPRSSDLACALSSSASHEGMCSLRLSEDEQSVEISSTRDPTESVNLEYLSLALQVRRLEGREPLFSLDPREDSMDRTDDPDSKWQVKRFEPEWIEGTSVGEVMFQADIYLKELSMGEYEQPVVGMKSCFDYYEEGGMMASAWNAREWFVVKKAEIQLSEKNVLIPMVKMGVEAREQLKGLHGMEDTEVTSPDHPLVKYADEFSRNFDLIAERKSAIYHLRELAKACALAKFLEDSVSTSLQSQWFMPIREEKVPCPLEIPQLWNERFNAKITVRNGEITNDIGTNKHGVYGGVELDMAKVMAGPAAAIKRSPVIKTAVQSSVYPALRGGPQTFSLTPAGPPEAPRVVRAGGLLSAALKPTMAPLARTAGLSAALSAVPGGAQGVDLNLDEFNLSSTATALQPEEHVGSWAATTGAIGESFWSNVDGSDSEFDQKDTLFLKGLFNPHLSDRRKEGDLFAPPDASFATVQQLKQLLQQEAKVCNKRKDHFYSKNFTMEEPGHLFPHSWTNSVGLMSSGATMTRKLQARPDYNLETQKIREIKSTMPVFDKLTEDGTRFRVYQVGNLEVRTTQEHDGEEHVGVVFSAHHTD